MSAGRQIVIKAFLVFLHWCQTLVARTLICPEGQLHQEGD
jgi:hypothetical protein